MDNKYFDIEALIIEVEQRPPIWNITLSEYSDKNVRKKLWEEIVDKLGGEEISIVVKCSIIKDMIASFVSCTEGNLSVFLPLTCLFDSKIIIFYCTYFVSRCNIIFGVSLLTYIDSIKVYKNISQIRQIVAPIIIFQIFSVSKKK